MRLRLIFLAFVFTWLCSSNLSAQQRDSVIAITGMVRDASQRLAYVNVSIKDSTLGTVTNEDGYFSLKIPATEDNITLVVSHVGYYASTMTVKATLAHNLRFILNPHPDLLDQAQIISYDPETLVRAALSRIGDNYPARPILQSAFYRETIQKGSRYTSVSEAVMEVYKTPYSRSVEGDRVKVLKARSLVSQKSSDTLSVKLQGGPTVASRFDVVKNRQDLFFEDDLDCYNYKFSESTVIEQRPNFVVDMIPRLYNEDYPMYIAKVYIDKETLCIMRVEYTVDMTDVGLVADLLLRKKPAALRFQPLEVSLIVTYRIVGDRSVMQYQRQTMRFKCDWKKKLLSSAYTLVSEMVATDLRSDDVLPFSYRDSFKENESFTDKIATFSDPDFWEDYNILEPSESLEHALGRLKRRSRQ